LNRYLAIGLAFFCLCYSALGGQRVTVIVSVTNSTVGNTNTFTLNGSTRIFTNDVSSSLGTLIQETNSVPYATTNFLNHVTTYTFSSGHILSQSASNVVRIGGLVDQAMVASIAGNWGFVTYSTQTVSTPTFLVRMPITVEAPTNQTNIATYIGQALDKSTYSLATNAPIGSNYLNKGSAIEGTQRVLGPVLFNQVGGTNTGLTNGVIIGARGTNLTGLHGTVFQLTNGSYIAPTLVYPVATNLTNYGLAISSPGQGTSSEQFGSGATATTNSATAVGRLATAQGIRSSAFGASASAGADDTVAIGSAAGVDGLSPNGVAIGVNAEVSQSTNGIAIGKDAFVAHTDSVAIGATAQSTDTNQVSIGSSTATVLISGRVTISGSQSNTMFTGTNTLNGDLALTTRAVTSLANGNNAGVVLGTNVNVRLSGASGAHTNCGFAATRDGDFKILRFANPGGMCVIANQSGVEPTAANRIVTGTGGELIMTNTPAYLPIIYNGTDSRWEVIHYSHQP
jgi:hypothetical protein